MENETKEDEIFHDQSCDVRYNWATIVGHFQSLLVCTNSVTLCTRCDVIVILTGCPIRKVQFDPCL